MSADHCRPAPPLSPAGALVERHWHELASRRRLYTVGGLALLVLALSGSLWFANETNAGKFFDRLPYFFDFFDRLVPRDGSEVWRALFDLPSPYDDGSLKYDYPEGRMYLTEHALHARIFLQDAGDAQHRALLHAGRLRLRLRALLPRRTQHGHRSRWLRFFVRRFLEILRAFPEIVIAGFFLAVLSLGPIPAIIAVSIHTVGALGKMFFEVVENADMKPDEGLRAAGGNWVERVWFGIVPQVLPNFMSYFLLRFEINVRASTIIGAVGGGGIGEVLRLSISQRPRGQDAGHHLPAVLRRSSPSTSSPPGCAAGWSANQAFAFGRGD